MLPFIDLNAQRQRLGARIDAAVLSVIDSGRYILGPEVGKLEAELGAFCGAKHVLGCANGTDAIGLSLMALKLKPGEGVICPAFTFTATAEVVAWVGAVPVFADIDETTYCISTDSIESALKTGREAGLKMRGVIAVDLFGHPADYDAIQTICDREGLFLISDSAQGFGATYKGRRTGSIGTIATTSFFPAKPLGCYGDGGAIFTDDADLMAVLRSLHNHGQGVDKYDNVRIGMNSRLDTIQAAILLEKLSIYEDEIEARQTVAARYAAGLGDLLAVPTVSEDCRSVWAQYVVRVDAAKRDGLRAHLAEKQVPTAVYYPKPLHRQDGYKHFPTAGNGLPVSDRYAEEVFALPFHPYLDEATQQTIIDAVRSYF